MLFWFTPDDSGKLIKPPLADIYIIENNNVTKGIPVKYSASVWKMACNGGKYTTSNWPTREPPTDTRKTRLLKKPIVKIDLV